MRQSLIIFDGYSEGAYDEVKATNFALGFKNK